MTEGVGCPFSMCLFFHLPIINRNKCCLQKLLEQAVQNFLAHTAKWTPCWFNKPKFHILLHLVEHIHQFGPAALFATNAFESFNALIYAKSIHSNHHAPSQDIGHAFAHGSHIWHLLSGACILM